MTVFLVLLIPLLLMVFALLMERVESRLRVTAMSEHEVEEFLDQAKPEEVNTFIREGWTRALAAFRLRRTYRPRRVRARAANGRASNDGPPPGGAASTGRAASTGGAASPAASGPVTAQSGSGDGPRPPAGSTVPGQPGEPGTQQ